MATKTEKARLELVRGIVEVGKANGGMFSTKLLTEHLATFDSEIKPSTVNARLKSCMASMLKLDAEQRKNARISDLAKQLGAKIKGFPKFVAGERGARSDDSDALLALFNGKK